MKLTIITPKKTAFESEVDFVTAPGAEGEFTVLPKHAPLFALLKEGVVKVQIDKEDTFFSIGGGYLETDGKEVHLLVSRAFGQDEIDEAEVEKARAEAEKILQRTVSDDERQAALELLRRSTIDSKLLDKVKRRKKAA